MLIKQSRFPIKQMLTVGLLPSSLKIAYYRGRGAKIGRNVSIGPGAVIVAREIEIGDGTTIGFGTYFKARKVQIGRHARIGSATFIDAETVSIGEDAKINEQVFVGGLSSPESHLRIGARTILMQHTFINVARPVTIGDDTGIGGRCSIFTHGSWQNQLDGYPVAFAPVTIGSNVWIPWEVFIMPGVTIGDGATIGARSLVTRDIPAGALAVGSPAKVIRTSDQYPARPDHGQQVAMLRGMLDEFCEAIAYEAFKVNRDRQDGSERITVSGPQGDAHVLLVDYEGVLNPKQGVTADAVLALVGVDTATRRTLESSGRLWLDLAAKQRGGPADDLGEEIVDFLKRFGIRFARTS